MSKGHKVYNIVFVVIFFIICILFANTSEAKQAQYDPITAYKAEYISGFMVRFNRRLLSQKELYIKTKDELTKQLITINRVVPSKPLSQLKKIEVWVEVNNRNNKAAEFHYSEEWLRKNGYNPKKSSSVEISNATHFVNWSRQGQPYMILHELSHGYEALYLNDKRGNLQAAYQNAIKSGLYQSVRHISGRNKTAYATTNYREYFAELTEAYFGVNDFYPFSEEDLKRYDSMGYHLIKNIWGSVNNEIVEGVL